MTAMSTSKSSTKRSQPGPKLNSSSSNFHATTSSLISQPPAIQSITSRTGSAAAAADQEKEVAAYYVHHPHPHHRRSRSMSDFSTFTTTNKCVSSDECNSSNTNDRVRRSTASWANKLTSKSTVQRAQTAANAPHNTDVANSDRRVMQRMTSKGSESDIDHRNNPLYSNGYRLRRPRSAASASSNSSTKTASLDRHKAMPESDADETSCYSSSSERSSRYSIPRTSRNLFGPDAPSSSSSSSSACSSAASSHQYHRPRHTLRRSSSHHPLSRHPVTPSPPTDASERDSTMDDATLCEAMRTEIWKAVEEIRMELRQSIEKTYPKVEALVAAANSDAKDLTVPEVVADVRKEYAEKLGQSEERVQQLWSQLAVEERRCLEFAKIVQELVIPHDLSDQLADPSSCTDILRDVPRVVDKKQQQQEEEQAMSRSLHEQAYKYFEECVSIIPGLTGVDVQSPAVQGEEMQQSTGEQLLVQEASTSSSPNKLRNCCVEHQDEKMVLPWLQWETEDHPVMCNDRPSSEEEFVETNNHYVPIRNGSSSNSNNTTCTNATATCTNLCTNSSNSSSTNYQYKHVLNPNSYPPIDLSSSPSSVCADRVGVDSSSRTIEPFEEIHSSVPFSPLEDLIWERLQFCSRIDSGHLILCEAPFW